MIPAFPRARDPNRSSVQLHQALDNGEPQTKAPMPSRGRGIGLPEPFEHVREELGAKTDTGVCHADFNVGIHSLQQDLDLSTSGCELDSVGEKIPHDLLKPARVAGKRTGRGIE